MSRELFIFLNWSMIIIFIVVSLYITFKVLWAYKDILISKESNNTEVKSGSVEFKGGEL